MGYDTPFGGVLQGLLTSQQIQRQKAQEIAEQVFREKQLDFHVKQFDAEEAQNKITNQRADKKLGDDFSVNLMDMAEKQYQFDTQQKRFEAERASREQIAKIKADSAKEIAEAKNLTTEERYILGEAIKNADTPEAAAGLQEWMRGRLRRSTGETTPAPPPTSVPGPPQMSLNPPIGSDLWNVLQGTPLAPAAPPPPGQAGSDPSKPFGGAAGAQTRSRNAYADIAEQTAAHLQDKFNTDALKAKAGVEHQKAVTAKLKMMAPLERDLTVQKIAESKARIAQKAAEIAIKERNTQWEHTYKDAALSLRKSMVGSSLDSIRSRLSTTGSKMVSLGKEADKIIAEVERLTADRDRKTPSLVPNGMLDGPIRDQRILELNARLEDVTTVKEAAKENYQHYRKILEDTGNLKIPGKPKVEKPLAASTPAPKRGAKGLAPLTLPNGIQMPDTRGMRVGQMLESQVRSMRPQKRPPHQKAAPQKAATPARKQETDAEIMARLRKKY